MADIWFRGGPPARSKFERIVNEGLSYVEYRVLIYERDFELLDEAARDKLFAGLRQAQEVLEGLKGVRTDG